MNLKAGNIWIFIGLFWIIFDIFIWVATASIVNLLFNIPVGVILISFGLALKYAKKTPDTRNPVRKYTYSAFFFTISSVILSIPTAIVVNNSYSDNPLYELFCGLEILVVALLVIGLIFSIIAILNGNEYSSILITLWIVSFTIVMAVLLYANVRGYS